MNLLSIGGSDPSSGAGIQSDIKTFSKLNVHGLSVITAITGQNTSSFGMVEPVSKNILENQLESVLTDFKIDGIKIGMVYNSEIIKTIHHYLKKIEVPIILCVNKIDNLNTKDKILPYLEKLGKKFKANEVFPLSAFKKNHTNDLRKLILKYLPQQEALFESDYVTDRSQRFVVAEFIREKLMRNLSNELPYDLTVEIEKFDLDGQMYRIAARIFVEKESQKSISEEIVNLENLSESYDKDIISLEAKVKELIMNWLRSGELNSEPQDFLSIYIK